MSFIEDIKKLFDNDAFTDLELKANDGQIFRVHKAIIAARSSVFYTMLLNEARDDQDFIDVPGYDSRVLEEVLRFIYCNDIEDYDDIAFDLLMAAEKYKLEGLKEILKDATSKSSSETLNEGFKMTSNNCIQSDDDDRVLLIDEYHEL